MPSSLLAPSIRPALIYLLCGLSTRYISTLGEDAIFDEKSYMQMHLPEDRPFLKSFIGTQAFSSYLAACQRALQ